MDRIYRINKSKYIIDGGEYGPDLLLIL